MVSRLATTGILVLLHGAPCLGLSDAGRALITRAMAGPVYVTDPADSAELLGLVHEAEAAVETPTWPQARERLLGNWRLVATTRTVGSEVLQQMGRQPALGTFAITQQWKEGDDGLRCDNVITIGRPNDGLLSAWTLLPAGGQSSLRLQHRAVCVEDGTPAAGRLRMRAELDAAILDGNRRAGDAVETIVSLPFPPRLPGLPPPPSLPITQLSDAIADAGTFDTTVLDESLRVVRGMPRRGEETGAVRIFVREEVGRPLPTW